jgi:hypothetical protein
MASIQRCLALLALVCLLLSGVPPARAAQPADIATPLEIPRLTFTPTFDGNCNDYANLGSQPYDNGLVYLAHDGASLYVCIQTRGSQFDRTFGAVYLDKGAKRLPIAVDTDYSLTVRRSDGANASYRGSGVPNGYVAPGPTGWEGKVSVAAGAPIESYEYRIPADIFGGKCGEDFGIAAYQMWVNAVGDDHGWPSNQFFDQPQTWQKAKLAGLSCRPEQRLQGKIAYVFRNDDVAANAFKTLLDGRGFSTTLVPLGAVLATDFSAFDLIIIADDTGSLNSWGTPPAATSAAQVAQILKPARPVLGVGEGGYAFFGQPALSLFIGWPNGWHGPNLKVVPTAEWPAFYTTPYAVPTGGGSVQVYSTFVNEVGIFLQNRPADAVVFGLEPNDERHAPLLAQGCRQLWGFSRDPRAMTADGANLFVNAVVYGLGTKCEKEPEPPPECKFELHKSATPAHGSTVEPGDTILYTLTYTVTGTGVTPQGLKCGLYRARLVDPVPIDTIFVPGSATDGIAPAPDGLLTWDLGTVVPGPGGVATGSKQFKVIVSEVQCVHQRRVNNRARLFSALHAPIDSNVVSHPVKCPPVTFPNGNPPYAQDEITIHPYPPSPGVPSQVSVRVTNNTAVAQLMTVRFQISPQVFGIGIEFTDFFTKQVTVPAHGNVIVNGTFTPSLPGHFCMQVTVEGVDPEGKPFVVRTSRNLDISEDFTDGQDSLTFKVRNPGSTPATMILVVDNTCPGWTATVTPASVALNPGEVKTVTLNVTSPPPPQPLGSGCHIDVQGWIDGKLIGGVRKLDLPPVGLPHGVVPSWLEPEITVTPNPPVVGQPNTLCVDLQNPLPVARTVTIVYAVADFGAGIPFVEVATKTVTIPANTPTQKYCTDWTPATGGTLHRCVRVTLKQEGYLNQVSQRNLNLVKLPGTIGGAGTRFKIGNPFGIAATLKLDTVVHGINPFWQPELKVVLPGGGLVDPPPDIKPGETLEILIGLRPVGGQSRAAEPARDQFRYGDVAMVDVGVSLNDEPIGGLSVEFDPSAANTVYLPLVAR